jgi:hypothetical protein
MKRKKYIFKADDGEVTLTLFAKSDQEAFIKLGSIVQEVSRFESFRKFRVKK